MPTVPKYDNLTVSENNISGGFRFTTADKAAQITQNQGTAISQGFQALGDTAIKIREQTEQNARELKVADRLNRFYRRKMELEFGTPDAPDFGFRSQKGEQALTRESGLPLPDEYTGRLQEYAEELVNESQDPLERKAFTMKAADLLKSFHGDAQKHYMGEFNAQTVSVRQGTADLMVEAATQHWGQPDRVEAIASSGVAAIVDRNRILGKSSTETQMDVLNYKSTINSNVVRSALLNDQVDFAKLYFEQQSGKKGFKADDILKLQREITDKYDNQLAIDAGNRAVARLSSSIPGSSNYDLTLAYDTIAVNAESGNRQFDDKGNTLTSPKDAYGAGQVREIAAKEVANRFGVTYDLDKLKTNKEYNLMMGRLYFQAQMEDFGSLDKAYAAYNAGPERLSSALKQAKKEGKDWLTLMPEETQNYVTKNVAAYESRVSGGTKRQEVPSYIDLENNILQEMGPNPTAQQVKLARTQAAYQHKTMLEQHKFNKEEALMGSYQWLMQNDYNYNALPASYKSQMLRYAPDKMDELIRFSESGKNGVQVTNPVTFMQLMLHPEELKKLSPSDVIRSTVDFRPSDRNIVVNKYNALREEEGKAQTKIRNTENDINMTAIREAINPWFDSMGINRKDDAERMGLVTQFVTNRIANEQGLLKRKLDDKEILTRVNEMFTNTSTADAWLGFSTTGKRTLSMSYGDIPNSETDIIESSLKASGVDNPTKNDVLREYFQREFIRNKNKRR